MLKFIDDFLNKITMYRLVLYYLIVLLGVAIIFSFFGFLSYNPIALIFTASVLVLVSWISNSVFAGIFKAQINIESAYITALILALIITPVMPSNLMDVSFLIWVAAWSMAAKYIFAISKKHIFNPVALAVALTAFTIGQSATWWIGGSIPMLAFVVLGGLLITRKIQRFDLVLSFFIVALVTIIAFSIQNPISALTKTVLHAPIFFLAFVMLTEPLTTPPTKSLRMIYGALVGFLFAPAVHLGSIYSTPELALLVGNIFSYLVSPKGKYILKLKSKEEVGAGTYDFIFRLDKKVKFRPGQYMEWTLSHAHADSRGNRRYFTIASSPTENDLRLGVKFYENPSSFKKKLLVMDQKDDIVAAQLAGDFILPKDEKRKIAFIAGGIGITPFRSMIKYLLDNNEKRSVVLFYSNRTISDIAYGEIFNQAKDQLNIKTIYTLTDKNSVPPSWSGQRGFISEQMILDEIPDYGERLFYISGPRSLVMAAQEVLLNLGLTRNQIKTDFFPGFA